MVEMIIVVVIIFILGTIGLGQYMAATERARAGKARSAMILISKAEKMFAQENGGAFIVCTNADLVANLGVFIEMNDIQNSDPDWDYAVAVGGGGFTVTATKAAGRMNAGETIILNQNGDWTGTFSP